VGFALMPPRPAAVPRVDVSKAKPQRIPPRPAKPQSQLLKTAQSVGPHVRDLVSLKADLKDFASHAQAALTMRREKRISKGYATSRTPRVSKKELTAAKLEEADAVFLAKKQIREDEIKEETRCEKARETAAKAAELSPPENVTVRRREDAGLPWFYLDDDGEPQGPFDLELMRGWHGDGAFTPDRPVGHSEHGPWDRLDELFPHNSLIFSSVWAIASLSEPQWPSLGVQELEEELERITLPADHAVARTAVLRRAVDRSRAELQKERSIHRHTKSLTSSEALAAVEDRIKSLLVELACWEPYSHAVATRRDRFEAELLVLVTRESLIKEEKLRDSLIARVAKSEIELRALGEKTTTAEQSLSKEMAVRDALAGKEVAAQCECDGLHRAFERVEGALPRLGEARRSELKASAADKRLSRELALSEAQCAYLQGLSALADAQRGMATSNASVGWEVSTEGSWEGTAIQEKPLYKLGLSSCSESDSIQGPASAPPTAQPAGGKEGARRGLEKTLQDSTKKVDALESHVVACEAAVQAASSRATPAELEELKSRLASILVANQQMERCFRSDETDFLDPEVAALKRQAETAEQRVTRATEAAREENEGLLAQLRDAESLVQGAVGSQLKELYG